MKYLLVTIALLGFYLHGKSQNTSQSKPKTVKYEMVDSEASFPGGMDAFYEYLGKNIKPTNEKGTILVSFVVETDGKLGDIEIIKGLSETLNKEAMRVVSESPKWTPGMQKKKPVRISYKVPITFN